MVDFIYFNSRDELLRIDVSNVVFFAADGNYTKIVLVNGFEGLVCINLGKMEQLLSSRLKDKAKVFARVGKSHIVNLKFILKIAPLRQTLVLSDQKSFEYSLDISKVALKSLKDLVAGSKDKNKE